MTKETKKPFIVRFWGTRGSSPAPGPRTVRYGGNTSCTEVRVGDTLIIIDCGTGVRELGISLIDEFQDKAIRGYIFIGHTHWDHIQGFPFFNPLYQARNRFDIHSARGAHHKSIERVLRGTMASDYFPVPLDKLACKLNFIEMNGCADLPGVKVRYHPLNHPGGAIGFRVESQGRVLSYVSDHETVSRQFGADAKNLAKDKALLDFVRGSDLFICEAQYSEAEYGTKKGWGHSTFNDVIDRAIAAEVKRLILFHHDPTHDDDMMDVYLQHCQERVRRAGSQLVCSAAQEGRRIEL